MPDFCKLVENDDQQIECVGCKYVGTLLQERHKEELRNPGSSQTLRVEFHHNYQELAECAGKGCVTCRVFQRALLLRQITGQEADELRNASQQYGVWARLPPTQGASGTNIWGGGFLQIGVGEKKTALVSCSEHMESVNLCAEPRGKDVVDEARGWLAVCHEEHSRCNNLGWSEKDNPSYLVYIRPGCTELQLQDVSQNKHLVRYAALSYSWGDETTKDPEQKRMIKATETTEENIEDRKNSFKLSVLPQTIQDAIRLTPPGTDWNYEASRMHVVYGNAYVTLAACSSIRSTDGIFHSRQAWNYKSKAYRLRHKYWLTNLDMPLKEVRLRTPLFKRAWTLQEERLSPRILYLCGQRLYWSCLVSQQTEMGPSRRSRRPQPFEGPDTLEWLRAPQEFLETRRMQDEPSLHEQWLEMVKAYTRRSMYSCGDRLPAMSGLAAQYISAYAEGEIVRGEEYLAGLWRRTFAQDLAWSLHKAKAPSSGLCYVAPTWSWASVPLRSDITTQHKVEPIGDKFKLLERSQLGKEGQSDKVLDVVIRGASIQSVMVRGPVRRFIKEGSTRKEWKRIRAKNGSGGEDSFDFSSCKSQHVHSRNPETGQIVAYEPRNQEIAGQLDYLFPEEMNPGPWLFIADDALTELYCLQIGQSTMLLLERFRFIVEEKVWVCRRVGLCTGVQRLFFASAGVETLVLI